MFSFEEFIERRYDWIASGAAPDQKTVLTEEDIRLVFGENY